MAVDNAEVMTPEDLKKLPLFECLPYKFLSWNKGAVVRRRLARGEVLCREGEYGETAYILVSGTLRQEIRSAMWHAETDRPRSVFSRMMGHRALSQASRVQEGGQAAAGRSPTIRSEAGSLLTRDQPFSLLRPSPRRVIGEGACLNNYPRASTVTATEPSVILEFRRNVLLAMLRNPASRQQINECYTTDSLSGALLSLPLFGALEPATRTRSATMLAQRIESLDLVRVHPRQVIFREGALADHMYIVRIGFVKVARHVGDGEVVLDYVGPGGVFGELGLVAGAAAGKPLPLPAGAEPGERLTTCTALDSVELIRIRKEVFDELIRRHPEVLAVLVGFCLAQVEKYWGHETTTGVTLGDYLKEGLQGARQLLVLDLERCTRCDECTKACADSHQGVTRLIRDGVRHGKYLVATSCRSCMNPYCMTECPVDAIHRGKEREIVIEDWCVGCGRCEKNCPYDNIRMVEVEKEIQHPNDAKRKVAVQERKATTCDLCHGFLKPKEKPSCVYACPHDAAFRMNGQEFLDRLEASIQSP